MPDTPATASSSARFTSRWGLILSVLGIAVGTGNIWRFPRIAASNAGDDGAGAFLVAWLVFLVAWSIPLIIAEYALGQRGRMGVVGTFAKLAGGKVAWLGAFVAFVAAAIMCYYSVVAGWCCWETAASSSKVPCPPPQDCRPPPSSQQLTPELAVRAWLKPAPVRPSRWTPRRSPDESWSVSAD